MNMLRSFKSFSPLVTVVLLTAVTFFAVVIFQDWISMTTSSIFMDVEGSDRTDIYSSGISGVVDNTLYFKNKGEDNLSLSEVKIGDSVCSMMNTNISSGMTSINLSEDCLENISGRTEIVIITNKGTFSRYVTLKGREEDDSATTPLLKKELLSSSTETNATKENIMLRNETLSLGYVAGGDHLLGHWRFDESDVSDGASLSDISGNNITTYVSGSSLESRQGILGSGAIEWNNTDDSVVIKNNGILEGMDNLTVEVWVYWMDDSASRQVVFGSRDLYEFVLDSESGGDCGNNQNLWWAIDNGNDWSINCIMQDLPLNRWFKLTMVQDEEADEVRFYVNGSRILTDMQTGTINTNGNDFGVGLRDDGFGSPASFKVDELRIWDRPFGDQEVEMSFFGGVPYSGTYVHEIRRNSRTQWDHIFVNTSQHPENQLRLTVSAIDVSNSSIGSVTFTLADGKNNLSLDLPESRNLDITLNATTTDITKNLQVKDLILAYH